LGANLECVVADVHVDISLGINAGQVGSHDEVLAVDEFLDLHLLFPERRERRIKPTTEELGPPFRGLAARLLYSVFSHVHPPPHTQEFPAFTGCLTGPSASSERPWRAVPSH